MAYTWTTFKDAVKSLMTDASRNDTSAVLAFVEFVKSRIALDVDKNPALSAAYYEKWVTQRGRLLGYTVTLAKDKLRAEVDKLLTVDAQRQGIQEMIDDLIEQAKNDLAGSAAAIDADIRHGVIELQHYIEFYRGPHQTLFELDDLTENGECSEGQMPDQCMPLDAYYVTTATPCERMPVELYDWQNRHDLICGSPRMSGAQFYITIHPQGTEFLLFPPIMDADHHLELNWDGIRQTFSADEAVPFDEPFVQAVADYTLTRMYLRPASSNTKMAAVHQAAHEAKRRQLYRDSRDRVRLRSTNESPQPQPRQSCAVVEEES